MNETALVPIGISQEDTVKCHDAIKQQRKQTPCFETYMSSFETVTSSLNQEKVKDASNNFCTEECQNNIREAMMSISDVCGKSLYSKMLHTPTDAPLFTFAVQKTFLAVVCQKPYGDFCAKDVFTTLNDLKYMRIKQFKNDIQVISALIPFLQAYRHIETKNDVCGQCSKLLFEYVTEISKQGKPLIQEERVLKMIERFLTNSTAQYEKQCNRAVVSSGYKNRAFGFY